METVQKILELSPDTLKALEQLAKITGAESVGELVQDALRLYEWIIFEQAHGKYVAALPASTANVAKWTTIADSSMGGKATLEDVEVIANLFDKDAEEEAKRFFKAA